jgi:3-hydroxyisobutyrate dehydrogenase
MSAAPLSPGARVGFIGLGNMGRPMAARLAQGGYLLVLCDARAEVAAEAAAELGASAVASAQAIGADLDALVLMVPDGHVVRQLLVSEGIADRLRTGSVVIDMSSSAPTGTLALGDELAAKGLHLLDAPVSGGVPRARTGELTIMAGGDADVVARCEPLLSCMGSRIYATGRLGSGQAMKALNNFVSAVGLIAACEAVVVGREFGIDPDVVAQVLNGSTGKNNTTEHKLRQFILSGSFASGFSLDLMVKDLGIASSVGDHVGAQPVLAQACLSLWSQAQDALGRGRDHTEMWRWIESTMTEDR